MHSLCLTEMRPHEITTKTELLQSRAKYWFDVFIIVIEQKMTTEYIQLEYGNSRQMQQSYTGTVADNE